jgi:uncharacterized protein (DUF885 family)
LDELLARVLKLDESALSAEERIERGILISRIRATLHDYREIRPQANDPNWYAEMRSGPLNCMLIFDYAPKLDRLRTVIAKERQIPLFLEQARRSLRAPAPIMIRYGIQGMDGALKIVRDDLPRELGSLGDGELQKEYANTTSAAAAALESFIGWLKDGIEPGGEGAYALGEARYAGWLRHNEMIETPLAELESWALGEIDRTRADMADCARRLEPDADAASVVSKVTSDHPKTGEVVPTLRKMAEEIYAWMQKSDLVSIPSPDRVLIDETPAFMRWTFGSMWSPGPFEKPGVRSTFYATDADPAWPVEKQHEHLAAFCYRGLENLTIHEAYPGHYIQGLHQNRVESLLRKSFWWGVFGEGWAHYCEMLAVDEGFGGGAPEARIVQYQEALNRLCRFVNGIRLHTRPGWSTEDGTRFFEENAWMTTAVARAESERGTFDAFYLRYTLGKKLILELRDECRKKLGSAFTLKGFHDALLGAGSAPMPAMAALTRLRLGIAEG